MSTVRWIVFVALIAPIVAFCQPHSAVDTKTGDSMLMQALLAGDVELASKLVAARDGIETANYEGVTPLIRTAARGNAMIARLLVQAGADVNRRDAFGATALSAAAHRGHIEIVKLLAESGADINAVAWLRVTGPSGIVRDDVTPLMLAAENGQAVAVAEFLLGKGANTEYRSVLGSTALARAVSKGSNAIARLLLEHGVNPNWPDVNGQSPLNKAVISMNIEMAAMLLKHGVDPNNRRGTRPSSNTRSAYAAPLIQAVSLKNYAMVELLLDNGALIDMYDHPPAFRAQPLRSMSALTAAVWTRDRKMVALLLARGANPNASNYWLDSGSLTSPLPVHAAARWGDAEMIDLLVGAGANAYGTDRKNANALHYAAISKNQAAIRRFVQIGLSLNQRTHESGYTPMMMAAMFADAATVDFLKVMGADPAIKSARGETAAALAAASGRMEALKLLQEYKSEEVNPGAN